MHKKSRLRANVSPVRALHWVTTMPITPENPTGLDEPDLPESVRQGLAGLYPPPPEVTAIVDHAVMASARRMLRTRRTPVLAWWIGIGAAAACLGVAALISLQGTPQRAPMLAAASAPLDLNADGRADILDAFRLARALSRPASDRPASWDVNADGRIDNGDVEQIARTCVALAPGPKGGA